jgi:beta-lactam-binding protein with PASTA domain
MSHFVRFLVSRVFWINVLVAILLVAGGLFGILYYLDTYTKHGEVIDVPEFVGMHSTETELAINQKGSLQTEVSDSLFVKGKAGGTILDQHPAAGNFVKEGRTIYLTVAAEQPVTIKMPKLVDRSLRQATSILETYGLVVGDKRYKPDMCVNCILEQNMDGKEIRVGERIRKGSVIDLVVGQGLSNELVEVPYLKEFTTEMANDLLQSKSLNLGSLLFDETVENADDSAKAIVYRQIPPFSQEPSVRMGASIDLFLTLDTNKVVHTVSVPLDTIQ